MIILKWQKVRVLQIFLADTIAERNDLRSYGYIYIIIHNIAIYTRVRI